jgi:mannose-6-phosphate isomerase-like protein (cupin superfamily)
MTAPGGAAGRGRVQVIESTDGPTLPIVEGAGIARAVVWPGMGAESRTLHRITLEAGSRTVSMRHSGEAVYFVREGVATVVDSDTPHPHIVEPGSMFFVEPDTAYAVLASSERVELVGGPSPPDAELYRDIGK